MGDYWLNKTMKIYYCRHGQSIDSENKCYQRPDSPLSQKGMEQAEIIALELRNFKFDKILCSPLGRAKQTALIINKKLNLEIEYINDLQEEKRPSVIEGNSKLDPINTTIVTEIQRNYINPNYRHSDEDTFEILKNRAINLKNQFEGLKNDSILVVSHGTILKMFTSIILIGETLDAKTFLHIDNAIQPSNTGIAVFEVTDNKWQLLNWNLLKF